MTSAEQNSIVIDKCAKLVGLLPAAGVKILNEALALRTAKELNRKKKEGLTPGIIEVATAAVQCSMHVSGNSSEKHSDKAVQEDVETFQQLFTDTFKRWSAMAWDQAEWNRVDAIFGNALKQAQEKQLTAADVLSDNELAWILHETNKSWREMAMYSNSG